MKFHNLLSLMLGLFIISPAIAAPHPTTGSSVVNLPKWSTVFSQMGFEFDLVSNEWIFLDSPTTASHPLNQQIDLGLKSLSSTARLSLKSEQLKTKTSVESYVKKYLRDYNQYGFEILSTKSMQINNSPVVILDLRQKNKATQSRQVFFGSSNRVTIASCLDKIESFTVTSNFCNQLLNTYKWR